MLVNLPPPKATRLVMAQCHTIQASYTNLDASVKPTERLTFAWSSLRQADQGCLVSGTAAPV